jgi:DNA-directed RNA polymerase subunit RPC12/RpoP
MASPSSSSAHKIVCPHCGKEFEAELMSGESDRHLGFKCPHCRLFVAYSRVEDQDAEEATGGS